MIAQADTTQWPEAAIELAVAELNALGSRTSELERLIKTVE